MTPGTKEIVFPWVPPAADWPVLAVPADAPWELLDELQPAIAIAGISTAHGKINLRDERATRDSPP